MKIFDKIKRFFTDGLDEEQRATFKEIVKSEITKTQLEHGYEVVDGDSIHIEMNGTIYLYHPSEWGYGNMGIFIKEML